jgi:hypothetical protein
MHSIQNAVMHAMTQEEIPIGVLTWMNLSLKTKKMSQTMSMILLMEAHAPNVSLEKVGVSNAWHPGTQGAGKGCSVRPFLLVSAPPRTPRS